jgi:hypothetical protein
MTLMDVIGVWVVLFKATFFELKIILYETNLNAFRRKRELIEENWSLFDQFIKN